MLPLSRSVAWAAVLTAGLGAGCRMAPKSSEPYPQDPLLLAKKPMETPATAAPAPTVQLAGAEPVRPPLPPTVLASLSAPIPVAPDGAPLPRSQVPAQTVAHSRGPVQATTAVRTVEPPPVVSGFYGHAADHSWLQGILDKHYIGHFDLRYCDPSMEDSWGGKVSLDNDPRLAQFKDGDVVRVVGELVPREEGSRETWSHYPRYHIREVQLIERRN
jgi:hypothetical protein